MRGIARASTIGMAAALCVGCASKSANLRFNFTGADIKYKRDVLRKKIDLINLADPEGRRFRLPYDECYGREPGEVDPATEFTCALQAAETYYLSYPEFFWYFDTPAVGRRKDREYERRNRRSDDLAPPPQGLEAPESLYARYKRLQRLNDLAYSDAATSAALAIRRNKIQDTILINSEEYCRDFKLSLSDRSTGVNLAVGATASLLSGLGSIFADPTVIRSVSGASGILQGWRGQFNEHYLQNAAIRTVNAGIDLAREARLNEINRKRFFRYSNGGGKYQRREGDPGGRDRRIVPENRSIYGYGASWVVDWDKMYNFTTGAAQKARFDNLLRLAVQTGEATDDVAAGVENGGDGPAQPGANGAAQPGDTDAPLFQFEDGRDYSDTYLGITSVVVYSLEAAIRDAILFHDACRIDAGLEAASRAIEQINNPSLELLNRVTDEAGLTPAEPPQPAAPAAGLSES